MGFPVSGAKGFGKFDGKAAGEGEDIGEALHRWHTKNYPPGLF